MRRQTTVTQHFFWQNLIIVVMIVECSLEKRKYCIVLLIIKYNFTLGHNFSQIKQGI